MILIDIRKSNKLKDSEYSAFIKFDYNSKIVDAIRELPFRYYNPSETEWEVPTNKVEYLINKLKEFDIKIFGKITIFEDKNTNIGLPEGFEFKTKPFSHQLEGVEYGLKYDRWFLGDEQGLGKALALDTKIYTYPSGYKLMRDIEVGDYVYGKDGRPTRVTATYYHKDVEMYRFTFSDGISIDCCKDHLWQIHTQHGYKVVDTNWFLQKNQFGVVRKDKLFSGGSYNYYIDRCEPVQFRFMPVDLHPYILGSLLGDGSLNGGSVNFTTKDEESVRRINELLPEGYILHSSASMGDISYNIVNLDNKPNPKGSNIIKMWLKDLKLMGTNSHTKFIPHIYKYNSPEIRIAVLQGLLDTDGYATKDNLVQYTTVSKQLAEDVRFLVESLGGMCNWYEGTCGYNDKITGVAYTLTIRIDDPSKLFMLERKRSLLKPRHFKPRRQIVSIERIENADAKCITVDSKDHLYLAEHFVVTHNTKQIIDIAVARKVMYGYRFCLIVCGVNTLKWNWVNEIHTHSKEDAYILGQRRKGTKIRIGSTKDKLEDLKLMYDIKEPHPYFIITNVESFRDKNIADTISDLCKKGIIGMCAADEMHKMKNPTAQQTKGFLKCLPYCRIGMTGTPLMNSPMDLYVILKWLGYESHAFYSFKQHYCVMGGYGGYEIVGYKNLDQLTAQVREIMLRRLKSEVLDLPEKIYVDDIVEMEGKQAVMYKEVEAGLKADYINGDIDLTNPLSALIRLRQTTGYPGILSDEITESAKLDRMEELVENCTSNDEKVLIFSNWTQITDAICNKLKSEGHKVGVITGETPDSSRQEIVDVFQNSSNLSVLVGTIGAMGTGLTLTAATTVIFVDEPWNKALFDQAVDRAHRIGQKNNITIYSIMCKDTIDERIHNLIYKKGAMSDAIIDGKVVGNKNEVFDYLLNG